MAKLIPFNGTVAELYNSYGQRGFLGQITITPGDTHWGIYGGAGYAAKVAGGSDHVFWLGDRLLTNADNLRLDGFVVVT